MFRKIFSKFHQDPRILPSQSDTQKIRTSPEDKGQNLIQVIQQTLGKNDDFFFLDVNISGKYPAKLAYFADFVDTEKINRDILKALAQPIEPAEASASQSLEQLMANVLETEALYQTQAKLIHNKATILDSLLRGKAAIMIEALDQAIIMDVRYTGSRAVAEPETEQVIRGPREGFVEDIKTNLGLVRKRLPTEHFVVKTMKIGRITQTIVAVCYLEDIVNPALVKEVNRRLSNIDIDAILDSGYLEQFITDNHVTPFPLIQNTERPDKLVASILEGRVGIFADGSPFALIAPAVFNQFYQSVDDYTERPLLTSFIRLVRLVALIFSLIFPSLYVSAISFNPELIPTEFAVAVAGGRAGVPFPAVVEVLSMEISMEVLREATIRLPKQVGGALSIVGVLVIGQAAVSAGFASPITVVVIALTTIGSFATPAYNAALSLRLLRFPLVLLAGVFGLYGVMVGLILITNHLLSLKSFGIPYISPLVPGNFQGMKDTLLRAPLWMMKKRPLIFHPMDEDRVGDKVVNRTLNEKENVLTPIKVEEPEES